MPYSLEISKDRFKFSSSHFTIFSETQAETLHGHNYQVGLSVEFKKLDAETGLAAEFSEVKTVMEQACQSLDEKILLPTDSPFLSIGETDSNLEVRYGQRFYSFPKEDCVMLPVVNTSSECLAEWLFEELEPAMTALGGLQLAISIQETRGQSVTFRKGRIPVLGI